MRCKALSSHANGLEKLPSPCYRNLKYRTWSVYLPWIWAGKDRNLHMLMKIHFITPTTYPVLKHLNVPKCNKIYNIGKCSLHLMRLLRCNFSESHHPAIKFNILLHLKQSSSSEFPRIVPRSFLKAITCSCMYSENLTSPRSIHLPLWLEAPINFPFHPQLGRVGVRYEA